MASMISSVPGLFVTELPPHCSPTTDLLVKVSTYLGVCVPTPQAALSTVLGCCSILSWLCAQMPQLVKNYKIKSTAGLSMFFLAEWLLGDAANLVGAVLTHQAAWQVTVASYYVFVDTCLLIQYFWYSSLRARFADGSIHSIDSNAGDSDDEMINSLSPINSHFAEEEDSLVKTSTNDQNKTLPKRIDAPQFSSISYEKNKASSPFAIPSSGKEGKNWFAAASPRTVLFGATASSLISRAVAAPLHYAAAEQMGTLIVRNHTTAEFIGTVIAWSSTFLYLGSRLPQLYKNWRLQSTAGLSPLLFVAAFCGNMFYTSSLFVNPYAWNNFGPYGGHGWADADGSKRDEWVASAAPFFLGAFGCLGLDVMIGVQFMLYGESAEKVVKVRDGRGHSHWERVNGWMRGWVPTLSRERVVDLAESQRLLTESCELDRHGHQSTGYGGT